MLSSAAGTFKIGENFPLESDLKKWISLYETDLILQDLFDFGVMDVKVPGSGEKTLVQFIWSTKVSISNSFAYFSILKFAYAMLK